MENPEITPDLILQYRKENRYTQKMFADELKISPKTVSAWENRKNPITDSMQELVISKFPDIIF